MQKALELYLNEEKCPAFPSHIGLKCQHHRLLWLELCALKHVESSILALKFDFIATWEDSGKVATGQTSKYTFQRFFFFLNSVFTSRFLVREKSKTLFFDPWGKVYVK